jgi:hypothetical protein
MQNIFYSCSIALSDGNKSFSWFYLLAAIVAKE